MMSHDLRRDALLPRVNLADPFEEILRRHALQQIAARSRFEGPLALDVALKRGQDDDAGLAELRPDGDHGVDAVHVGKPQVHQRHVGLMLAEALARGNTPCSNMDPRARRAHHGM
jgi:hypothetical protein